jgi:hypothetical protein
MVPINTIILWGEVVNMIRPVIPSTTGAGHRNGSFDPSELDDEIEPAAYIAARLESGELVELDVPVQGIAPFVQL